MWYVEKGCLGTFSRLSRGIKEKVGVDVLKSRVLLLKGFEEVWLGPRKSRPVKS